MSTSSRPASKLPKLHAHAAVLHPCPTPSPAPPHPAPRRSGWGPTYCGYDSSRTGPYCGGSTPPGAFRINRLFAADGNGNARAGCEPLVGCSARLLHSWVPVVFSAVGCGYSFGLPAFWRRSRAAGGNARHCCARGCAAPQATAPPLIPRLSPRSCCPSCAACGAAMPVSGMPGRPGRRAGFAGSDGRQWGAQAGAPQPRLQRGSHPGMHPGARWLAFHPPTAVDNSMALWAGIWGENKESGVCTGLDVGDWMRLALQLRDTYDPDVSARAGARTNEKAGLPHPFSGGAGSVGAGGSGCATCCSRHCRVALSTPAPVPSCRIMHCPTAVKPTQPCHCSGAQRALQGSGIKPGSRSSGAAISEALREAYGKQPRVHCQSRRQAGCPPAARLDACVPKLCYSAAGAGCCVTRAKLVALGGNPQFYKRRLQRKPSCRMPTTRPSRPRPSAASATCRAATGRSCRPSHCASLPQRPIAWWTAPSRTATAPASSRCWCPGALR